MGTHGNKLNATECIHSSSFLDIHSVNEKSHVSAFGISRCKFGEPLSPGISQKELCFFGLSRGEVKS